MKLFNGVGRLVLSLACALGMMSAFAANKPDFDQAVEFSIPAQSLSSALLQFAKQSRIQVLTESEDLDGYETKGVEGRLTANAALVAILQGTGLSFRKIGDGTVTIRREEAAGGIAEQGLLRLAQNESGEKPESRQQENTTLDEIVVTAQKREQKLQDVPISMSVLRGEDLDSSAFRDVTEALSRVPGVTLSDQLVGGTTQVTLRGVAAGGADDLGPPTTAFYLDSVPFGFVQSAFVPSADVYDLDRVEVLRGPQGTLYGASALNGVVRVLTKDANPNAFEFKARGFTSSTEDGDWNYRGDMAVNVPIVEGKLAARAVLGYQDLSGWIDKPIEKDANDAQRGVARLKLNAQPTDQLSIGLSVWASRADHGAPSIGTENRYSFSNIDEPISEDFDSYGLKVGYAFSGFSVTSMTSYLDYANKSILDLARTPDPDSQFWLDSLFDAQTFAQEVIFNSTQEGAWRWSAGAMYRDSEEEEVFHLPPVFTTPIGLQLSSESYAVFGELTRVFSDGRWDLTAGGRYFEDKVAVAETSRLTPFTPDELIANEDTFDATTPRVVLTWHPSKQMNLYASYSQGFRSGWHNHPQVPFPSVKPDKLTNYELGSKGSFWGGRLALDAALYYVDWKDVQQIVVTLVPGTTDTFSAGGINGESASGIGVDFGITAKPVDALELGLNVSWNDLASDAQVFSGDSGDVLLFDKGDRLNVSPEYTLGGFADYVFPLGGGGLEGQFSFTANYTAESPYRVVSANELVVTNGDPMLIVQTSISIRAARHWTASLFVDNLTDEKAATFKAADDLPGDRRTRVRPRTVGVQLEYQFE